MSLKTVGITIAIGAIFEGAKAIASSNISIDKLGSSIDRLKTKRATLRVDSEEAKRADTQLHRLGATMDSVQRRNLKIKTIMDDRANFRSSMMDKVALGASIVVPIKTAIDFESSMADVKKVVDFTSKAELDKFSNDLIKLTRTIPMSANELAQVAASGGQLGIAKKELIGFTEIVSKMSTAFDMSASDAGDSIAKIMNVYSLNIEKARQLGDAINHLSNNSASKARDIVNVLSRVGGNASLAGLTGQEAGAMASTFLSLGKSSEEAGTSINAFLLRLQTPEKQNKDFMQGLKDIGISAKQLKKEMDENPTKAIDSFLERLAKVKKTEKMGVLSDLFGGEYSDDLALFLTGIDQYKKALESIRLKTSSFEIKGVEQAFKKIDSKALKFGIDKEEIGALSSVAIKLGKSPKEVGESFNSMLGKLKNVDKESKEFRTALNGMGISAKQLKEDIEKNPQKALDGFFLTLSKVKDEDRKKALNTMFNKDNAEEIDLITEHVNEYNEAMKKARNYSYNGSMEKEFQARSATTANNIQLFKNGLGEIGITIGSVLLPPLNQGLNVLKGWSHSFANWADKNKELVGTIGGVIAGLGALSIGLSIVKYGVGFLISPILKLRNGIGLLRAGAKFPKSFGDSLCSAGGCASQTDRKLGGLRKTIGGIGKLSMAQIVGISALSASIIALGALYIKVGSMGHEAIKNQRITGNSLAQLQEKRAYWKERETNGKKKWYTWDGFIERTVYGNGNKDGRAGTMHVKNIDKQIKKMTIPSTPKSNNKTVTNNANVTIHTHFASNGTNNQFDPNAIARAIKEAQQNLIDRSYDV
jgi:TP901 family phage tail tape measure protein